MSLVIWEQQGYRGSIILNRPDRLNAINNELLADLDTAISAAEQAEGLRIVMVKGKGRCFAAGADIAQLAAQKGREGIRFFHRKRENLLARLEALPCPTLAVIQGYALGSGLELALACDLRLAADTARVGVPSARLGIVESYEYIGRLVRAVGVSRAKEMLFTGRRVPAAEACQMGLLTHVVAAAELEDEALRLAKLIENNSPVSVQGSKQVVNRCAADPNLVRVEDTAEPFYLSVETKDFQEGTSAFREKRKPVF